MITIYRLLYFITLPFFLFFGLLLSRKIRRFMFMRESNLKKQNLKTYWIHVSSGEFEHAKPVLRELRRTDPYTKIVVSYSSPSYLKAIKSCKEVDFYTPFKLDLKAPVTQLIRTINPKAMLIARTDLWPELLEQLRLRKIPSLVFARHESGKNTLLKKISYGLTYQKLTHISFVSEEDAINYKKIKKPSSYSIDGDPRVEEVFFKKEQLNLNDSEPIKDSLILGSTWAEDIQKIKTPIIKHLEENTLKKLIIAPHEPTQDTINNLKETFKNFDPTLYTEDKELNSRVVIVDEIGHLFKLYNHCEIAFVGGSFKKKVHSVIEPLSFGLPVLLGPKYQNSFEAKKFSNKAFIKICKDSNEFEKSLKELLNNKPLSTEVLKSIRFTHLKNQRQVLDPSQSVVAKILELQDPFEF